MLGNQKFVLRSFAFFLVFAAILGTSPLIRDGVGVVISAPLGNHQVLSADGTGPQPKPIPLPAPWTKAAA
jgi:hypothetical protein